MLEKPLDEIGAEDVERLQSNGVPESLSLDYKQVLPGNADDDRKEFLADVSSLANASGGDLIFGVVETRENGKGTGIPERIDGLKDIAPDAEILRLENMLRDGIAPRIPGVRLRRIDGFAEGPVLIVRVPRSWAGPHMVTYKQHSRFYARNSAGKYALDVFEIRRAFLESGSLGDRAKEFRTERLGRILAGETPARLTKSSVVCVHFIPHAAFAGAQDIDLKLVADRRGSLAPLYSEGHSGTFNLDGYLTSMQQSGRATSVSYLQVFRSGALETVSSELVGPSESGAGLRVPSLAIANELDRFLRTAIELMKAVEVDPPASIFISLLDVKGAVVAISPRLSIQRNESATPFDRDNLLFRDVLLREWAATDSRTLLRPMLDEMWQAAGMTRCFDYDDQGIWNPR